MKYGRISGESGTQNLNLQWYANGQSQWEVQFNAGVWHNIANGIEFHAGTVTFHHSTGSNRLAKTAGPVSVNTYSDGKDWHLGVLRLSSTTGASDAMVEDWHFSGVYIESGSLKTRVSGPRGSTQ